MTATFSSSEASSLERTVDLESSKESSSLSDIWTSRRLVECQLWVSTGNYKKICLQFPDSLLEFSAHIADELKCNLVEVEVFILGDTSYGSCCVDEVAASHVAADAIIHFGHACLSKVVRLPLFYVFPNFQIDVTRFYQAISDTCVDNESITVFYDVGYYYQLECLRNECNSMGLSHIRFAELAVNEEADTLCWKLDKDDSLSDCTCIYIGRDDQTLFNLTLSVSAAQWFLYDGHQPDSALCKITAKTSAWMRRRNFYIEKCKDARTLGIVVGTLTTNGYLDVVKHCQQLARHRNIRTYLISVGKVNPSKLANFMEIDCFVLVGCPENNLFASRDFYKPLLSVFEVEMALNAAWQDEMPANYSVDFKDILPQGRLYREYANVEARENDVSLLTGQIRFAGGVAGAGDEAAADGDKALVARKNHQLMTVDGNGALGNRTWAGLDPVLGKTEPSRLEEGRAGLAIKYKENVT